MEDTSIQKKTILTTDNLHEWSDSDCLATIDTVILPVLPKDYVLDSTPPDPVRGLITLISGTIF